MDWLFLQLVDGSFPSGGFAHSLGLEASTAIGRSASVEDFLDDALLSSRDGALPFVRAACTDPDRLADLDDAIDATILFAVPNRASRAQGRAFAGAAARIFGDHEGVRRVSDHARTGPAHHAPVFGAIFGALGVGPRDAMAAHLHATARSVLSAAVRLNLVGPLEAQRIHASRAELLGKALDIGERARLDDVAQSAPLVELWGALHDRLDARLFQS